jgi:hypothetical protein
VRAGTLPFVPTSSETLLQERISVEGQEEARFCWGMRCHATGHLRPSFSLRDRQPEETAVSTGATPTFITPSLGPSSGHRLLPLRVDDQLPGGAAVRGKNDIGEGPTHAEPD